MDFPPELLANLSAIWAALSFRPVGLVTDVDGTISRIVDRPEMAWVEPRIVDCLRRLVARFELVAAVSGRSTAQLSSMLEVEGMVCVGNHGLEWWEDGRASVDPEAEPYLPAIAGTLRHLRDRPDMPGVLVEDKGATGAVHYRLSTDPAGTRRAILRAIAECPAAQGLRVADGRMVVNLLPPVRANKGTAVERLVRLRRLRTVLYLGDDLTGLDAFRALRSLRASGLCNAVLVAVAGPETPTDLLREADFTLDGIDAVASFLEQTADRLDR